MNIWLPLKRATESSINGESTFDAVRVLPTINRINRTSWPGKRFESTARLSLMSLSVIKVKFDARTCQLFVVFNGFNGEVVDLLTRKNLKS